MPFAAGSMWRRRVSGASRCDRPHTSAAAPPTEPGTLPPTCRADTEAAEDDITTRTQLVVYPILDLARHTQDLHWYLRSLEEVLIRALASTSGLAGERLAGLTGVWVGGHKLAAIGVRARKWVTNHGLALNDSTGAERFVGVAAGP